MSNPLRILQIAPRMPWPLNVGGNIGIYNITRALARRGHGITFVCFGPAGTDAEPMRLFSDVHVVEHDTRTRPSTLLTNLCSSSPYTISKYRCARMDETLRRLCRERSFDAVHIDHIHMAPYGNMLKREFGLPLLVREHNFETTIYERFAEQQHFFLLRWYMRMQTRRLLRFETEQLRHADVVAAITREDAARIGAVASRSVEVIPAGVDLETHTPTDALPEDSGRITLLGSMAWEPNLDSVRWFATKVWPRIAAEDAGAMLTIAGDAPPRSIRELANSRVEVPGFVDDLDALLARSTVLAVPLRIGGGMRIKLLEYFARGKAVVSTSIGAEGNLAADGEHLLIADTADTFADAVLHLLRNPDLRRRLGANARTLAENVYSWDAVALRFEECYRKAIND